MPLKEVDSTKTILVGQFTMMHGLRTKTHLMIQTGITISPDKGEEMTTKAMAPKIIPDRATPSSRDYNNCEGSQRLLKSTWT